MKDVTAFNTERPKSDRIHVTARDPESGKSKTVTLYGIGPAEFIEAIKSIGDRGPKRKQFQPA